VRWNTPGLISQPAQSRKHTARIQLGFDWGHDADEIKTAIASAFDNAALTLPPPGYDGDSSGTASGSESESAGVHGPADAVVVECQPEGTAQALSESLSYHLSKTVCGSLAIYEAPQLLSMVRLPPVKHHNLHLFVCSRSLGFLPRFFGPQHTHVCDVRPTPAAEKNFKS
jgi:hypothetical protein